MTNTQALQATLGEYQASANALEKALTDQGLSGLDAYTAANLDQVNLAAVAVLSSILVSSVSEGGYSITYDRSGIEALIASLGGGSVPKITSEKWW